MVAIDVDTLDLPEIDLFGDRFRSRDHRVLAEAREENWLARSEIGYLVLTYDAVHAALRHPDLKFASMTLLGEGDLGELMYERSQRNLLHRHGERHTRFRKLVNRAFTPRTVDRVRPDMRQLFNDLLDPVCARGSCEFVRESRIRTRRR